MKISKPDESSLLIALTEGFQSARITYYGYILLPENWEENVKVNLDEEFSKKLFENLDDGGLSSLIQRNLMRKFNENVLELPPKDTSKLLSSYPPFKDALKISRDIVAVIKEIPYQYQIIVRALNTISSSYLEIDEPIRISDRMSIVSGKKIKEEFLTSTGEKKIDDLYIGYNSRDVSLKEIDEAALYFSYRASGYVSDRNKPKHFASFYEDIRAFYGASISFGLFYGFSASQKKTSVAVLANSINGTLREFQHCEVADRDITDCAALMTKKALDEKVKAGEHLSKIFGLIIKLFNGSEYQRLKTAAIWLLRAHRAENGMDQILDSTIAVEVLLGDREASDRVGLSKLMANRCAYSLGKTSNERKQLHDFFIRFYKVRSDIVHSGRLRLTESESEVVEQGTDLAARILKHETEIS